MTDKKVSLKQMLEDFLLADADIAIPPVPVREQGEPSLQEYEDHVKGIRVLPPAVLRELNRNPRWQRSLAIFRKDLGFRVAPVAAETWARIRDWLNPSLGLLLPVAEIHASTQGRSEYPEYKAAIEDDQGRITGTGMVGMLQFPFLTKDDHLVMRLCIKDPVFTEDSYPIQLLLLAFPDHEQLSVIDLLENEQLIKIKVSTEFAARYRGLPSAASADLPFGFVIRAGYRRNLVAH